MREVFVMGILLVGLWGASEARASVPPVALRLMPEANEMNCRDLVKDLRSFQKAQNLLMQSFAQRSETLAETLDLYKFDFQSKNGRLKTSDFLSLSQSADAFRSHSERESKLVDRFERTSAHLLEQVVRCLQNSPTLSQNATLGSTQAFGL